MRLLIAVISYYQDAARGSHQAIRDTWGREVAPADLRFFIPKAEYAPLHDEVFLDVPQDYDHISDEVRGILRWSVEQNYDFTFLCCNDLFCVPKKLFDCGFEQADYSGVFYPPSVVLGTSFTFDCAGTSIPDMYPWTNGGWGWFMSQKAAKLVIAVESIYKSAGDIYIGQVLGPLVKINEVVAKRISLDKGTCWHYREIENKTYDPATGWMQEMYAKQGVPCSH